MARAIDVVQVLNDINWHHKPTPVSEFESGFNQGLNQAMWTITHAPTLAPPNEWVSVEDAVPDPGARVFATDGIFVGEAYRSSANSWFRHTGFPWRDGVTGRTVRFWMPLPAPPTKEE